MELKRLYAQGKVVDVKVLKAGPQQKFSPEMVQKGVREGWLEFTKDHITVKAVNGEVRYRIVREPGHYCCHCGVTLEDANQFAAPGLSKGRKHVLDEHGSAPSPDRNNPSGYEKLNAFLCEKE